MMEQKHTFKLDFSIFSISEWKDAIQELNQYFDTNASNHQLAIQELVKQFLQHAGVGFFPDVVERDETCVRIRVPSKSMMLYLERTIVDIFKVAIARGDNLKYTLVEFGMFMRFCHSFDPAILIQQACIENNISFIEYNVVDYEQIYHLWKQTRTTDMMPTISGEGKWNFLRSTAFYEVGMGRGAIRMELSLMPEPSKVRFQFAANKYASLTFLRTRGYPAAEVTHFNNFQELKKVLPVMNYPVVLKPNHDSNRVGVFVGLNDAQAVLEAFKRMKKQARYPEMGYLLGPEYFGNTYRVSVAFGKVLLVASSKHVTITGDGQSTIFGLAAKKLSLSIKEAKAYSRYWENVLFPQGKHLDQVLSFGEEIRLSLDGNDGGSFIDVTSSISEENANILISAAQDIGLEVVGFDIVALNLADSLYATGGAIVEVNPVTGIDFFTDLDKPKEYTNLFCKYLKKRIGADLLTDESEHV